MKIIFNKAINDGSLTPDTGRIVMLEGLGFKSNGPSMDHNDCLRAFARRYGLHKDDVISHSYRYYYIKRGDKVLICPVRKIDEDYYYDHQGEFKCTIDDLFTK